MKRIAQSTKNSRRPSQSGGSLVFSSGRTAGFTLIELILVMTILTIAISLTAPALANFFRGRALDSEARRLLALTRLGQSRAVAEGLPVQLWVDSSRGECGLEADSSYDTVDAHAVDFTVDKDLQIETANNVTATGDQQMASSMQSSASSFAQSGAHSNLPHIRFLPDGSIGEGSPQVIRLSGRDGFTVTIALGRSRLSYEIRTRKN